MSLLQVTILDPHGLYNKGHEYTMKCSAEGYPIPEISWLFKPCSSFTECSRDNSINVQSLVTTKIANSHNSVSMIREVARRSGEFTCQACNKVGCTFDTVAFFVTDITDGFHVDGPPNVLVGEAISLKCSASIYNFSTGTLEWYKDTLSGPKRLETGPKYKVDVTSTAFSVTKELALLNVTLGDKGRYMCKVRKLEEESPHVNPKANRRSYYNEGHEGRENSLSFNLNVLPLEPPVFIETNMVATASKEPLIVERPEDGLELKCRVAGRPWPLITWSLNGAKLYPTVNTTRVQITEDNQVVKINYVSKADEGVYECHAQNRVGVAKAEQLILLKSTADKEALYSKISLPVIIAVVGALLLVALLIGLAKICYSHKKKKAAKVEVTTPNLQAWKEPATPPTPRLNQFDLTSPQTSYSTNEDDECRVTLTSSTNRDEGSVSPANSFRAHAAHPCCTYAAPAAHTSHCHYQAVPINEVYPCQMSSKISICECSNTLGHANGTLERHFPHLYSRNITPSFNGGTLHRFNHYENHHPMRSRSHSPSRRSAEY